MNTLFNSLVTGLLTSAGIARRSGERVFPLFVQLTVGGIVIAGATAAYAAVSSAVEARKLEAAAEEEVEEAAEVAA